MGHHPRVSYPSTVFQVKGANRRRRLTATQHVTSGDSKLVDTRRNNLRRWQASIHASFPALKERITQTKRLKTTGSIPFQFRKLKGKARDVSPPCSIQGFREECCLNSPAFWYFLLILGIPWLVAAEYHHLPPSSSAISMPINLFMTRTAAIGPVIQQFGLIFTWLLGLFFFFKWGHICRYQRLKFQHNCWEDTIWPITVRCGDLSLNLNFGPLFVVPKA